MNINELQDSIKNRTAGLAVIGLGYVGLPVAAAFAEAGFDVVGIDIQSERVDQINKGRSPIEGDEPGLAELLAGVTSTGRLRATTDYAQLSDRDVLLIDVETPVDEQNIPRYEALRSVIQSLGPIMKKGALVIVESTVAPGTITGLVLPMLEQCSRQKLNEGFYLGACPERVMPGKLLKNLRTLSRVAGGMTPETSETMIALYGCIVHADLDAADCVTAELVKTTENAYRDVQIAFANEIALICETVGGDVWKVRELVNKSPMRQMHLPGAGVGGHCIPKDPWLLAYGVKDGNVPLRLIPAARAINDSMPIHIANLLAKALAEAGRDLKGAKVAVLGYAYLENSDDTRNSPARSLVARLDELGAQPIIHDPWISEYDGEVFECIKGCDAVVIMVAHNQYRTLDLLQLKSVLRQPILVDGRNIINAEDARAAELQYYCVGVAG